MADRMSTGPGEYLHMYENFHMKFSNETFYTSKEPVAGIERRTGGLTTERR